MSAGTLALAVLLIGCGSSSTGTAPEPATQSTAGATPDVRVRPAVPARRAPGVVVPQAPTSARLPSGVVVPIRAVSTRRDGELAVPQDIRTAGWWRGGSRLGDPFGSMLVAAHVDSTTQGLGPYAELLAARRGQRVRISSAALVQDYVIRARRLVPQAPLTRERSIFAPSGAARLTLVTCAPPYVKSQGGYQNLAVVTALPVGEPHRRRTR